jgi:hypothetical protein
VTLSLFVQLLTPFFPLHFSFTRPLLLAVSFLLNALGTLLVQLSLDLGLSNDFL